MFVVSTEELESDCASAAAHIFRDQKILQGTSYRLLASAVGSSPSVLEAMETSKAEKVLRLAGSSASTSQPKVRDYGVQRIKCLRSVFVSNIYSSFKRVEWT